MAQPNPLQAYLKASALTMTELRSILLAGAEEADNLIPKLLEKHTTGGTIKAAQLSLVRREIAAWYAALWGDIGSALKNGIQPVVLAAADGEDILFKYLDAHDAGLLRASFQAQAKKGLAGILARAFNNIPLSSQVYRTQALSKGWVDRAVNNGILLGHGAKQIAKDVSGLIKPNVKGGVAYAANRLARTELNHAFKTTQQQRYADEPWNVGMEWNLSGSHPKPDICNLLATQDIHGLGKGVYPTGDLPRSHPNCLCYWTPATVDEDTFIDSFVAGDYNEFIDETVYTHAPKGLRPCP